MSSGGCKSCGSSCSCGSNCSCEVYDPNVEMKTIVEGVAPVMMYSTEGCERSCGGEGGNSCKCGSSCNC